MARILIVDDEADVAEGLSVELQREGYETVTASDGVEAILNVIEGSWDGILMDIRMPNLDGVNALRVIRKLSPNIPVIMFTGQAGQGEMLASTQLGAYTCLLKPVSFEKLIGTLEQVIPKEKRSKKL